jgi:hypothetical protein
MLPKRHNIKFLKICFPESCLGFQGKQLFLFHTFNNGSTEIQLIDSSSLSKEFLH